MKAQYFPSFGLPCVVCVAILLAFAPGLHAQQRQPVITSVQSQGTQIRVGVHVPAGVQRLTLEMCPRLGIGAWVPAAVAYLEGAETNLTFYLASTRPMEMLRVRADARQPLPGSFYHGTNWFSGPPTNPAGIAEDFTAGGGRNDGPAPGTPVAEVRDVVESDIWRVDGNTLYFFNQYRGLQVIDITDPDHASVRCTLSMPAAGEQMYLADSNHVILLASGGCSSSSRVVITAVAPAGVTVVTNLPLDGYVQESRMVGTALYIATQTCRPAAASGGTTWEWGTLLSSFDLSDPEHPVTNKTLWFTGYGNVVNATDKYFFLVTQEPSNWWQSQIHFVDITAPDGSMSLFGSVTASGQINDKFKLDYSDDILTTISEDWHTTGARILTRLETFQLPDPRAAGPQGIVALGKLELGNGERLHATRFDGKLVYVVTFLQKDPLWVVDLSNPSEPRIAGELEVPGWSTYIYPMGSRLVSVGVEANRVAVSLFDVREPDRPALLSRVLLGDTYSWSEANNDEKALTVLPDVGMILLPYNGNTTNGWSSQVQIIDLKTNSLVARGLIEHQCQPRRATFANGRIISLSAFELLSVDATDRDAPQLRCELPLAWSVDKIFVQGEFLIELTGQNADWSVPSPPALRITSSLIPDVVLNSTILSDLPVVGAALKDDRLFIAQSPLFDHWIPQDSTNPAPTSQFLLTAFDLSALPSIKELGRTSTEVQSRAWNGDWKPLWPKPDLLVWVGGGANYWLNYRMPWLSAADRLGAFFYPWPTRGAGTGQLLAFDVATPAEPRFVSRTDLATSNPFGFTRGLLNGSQIYLSHSVSEPPSSPQNDSNWIQRSYLDVVDFADPANPTVRPPVNIPGELRGISREGELLYTTAYRQGDTNSSWNEWLDAVAYDGVSAHLVTSLALPEVWPHPVLIDADRVILGRPGYNYRDTNVVAHALETWSLAETGQFTLLGSVTLASPASSLWQSGALLVTQETDGNLAAFDASSPDQAKQLGTFTVPGCVWFDLSNAQGSLQTGFWAPLGSYGIYHLSW